MKKNYDHIIKETAKELNIHSDKVKKVINNYSKHIADTLNYLPYADVYIPGFCRFSLSKNRMYKYFKQNHDGGLKLIKRLNAYKKSDEKINYEHNPIIKEYLDNINNITNYGK